MIEKKTKGFKTKETSFKALDIDEGSRRVKGLLSGFNVIDSDQDMILKGAFSKSIKDRGPQSGSNRQIAYLWAHDILQPIGKFLELEETDEGLQFVAEMGRSTIAKDTLLNYQDGIIREHSIGFQYPENDKMSYIDAEEAKKRGYDLDYGFFEIREVKLFEGSAVMFGANEFTPTLEVAKGETLIGRQEAIENQIQGIVKAIRNGEGSDDRLQFLDIFLEQISAKYNALVELAKKPNHKDSLLPEDEPRKDAELLEFFKSLK